jgi:hypothetical protein
MLSHVRMTVDRFGLDIGFIDHLQIVNTSNYNTITNFHTLQITTAHAVFSVCYVFTGRSLIMPSNSGDPSAHFVANCTD